MNHTIYRVRFLSAEPNRLPSDAYVIASYRYLCEHVGHLIKCEQNELPAELIYICMIILYEYI